MEPVRFALVGYGAWGSHHARAISSVPAAVLTAIVEPSEEGRGRAQAEHPGVTIYADYRELLDRDTVDVVDIVIPTDRHHEVGKASLQAGCHLLMEKPMAAELEQCDELISLAQSQNRVLAVGHEFRVSSLWGRVKQLIDAGDIGEPLYCLIELWRNPYRLGSEGWRYDIRRVKNWIMEEPIHFFDLARWYLEAFGNPTSVFAQANAKRADHPELQDNFTAMLRFPAGRYALVSQTLAGWEHHQVVKITGTDGALWANWSGAMDRTFEPKFWLKHKRGDQAEEVPITTMTGEVYELVEEIATVARCVREGGRVPATGEDGRWSVAMCLKAQESVDRGDLVTFD